MNGRAGRCDVVEWLARQPWPNGKVAMCGGSYARFDQWSMAKEFPSHLATCRLKSGAKPEFLKKRVAYYATGAEGWKYADSLAAVAAEHRVLYLDSDGSANDAFHSGPAGRTRTALAAADRCLYGLLDNRFGELEWRQEERPVLSQRHTLNIFGNGVVCHIQPSDEDIEVRGFLKLTLWFSMDVPDTDLEAQAYDIQPDGTSIALTSAVMRARYSESLRRAKPVPAGEIVRYTFDDFTWFSRRIAKGSRLRLVLHLPKFDHCREELQFGRRPGGRNGQRRAHGRWRADGTGPPRRIFWNNGRDPIVFKLGIALCEPTFSLCL